jgi:L-lysine 2,3-aminomutase
LQDNPRDPEECATIRLESLKAFRPAGRGAWSHVADAEWNDWHWQLKHRVTNLAKRQRLLPSRSPAETAGTEMADTTPELAITPYFFTLIDPADDTCPIRQVIPRVEEMHTAPWEMVDPCGIAGSDHQRAGVRQGLEIMEALRGPTSSYAIPQYVIDAPGGGGKVPVNPEYILSRNADRVVIRNFESRVFEYVEGAAVPSHYKSNGDFNPPEPD